MLKPLVVLCLVGSTSVDLGAQRSFEPIPSAGRPQPILAIVERDDSRLVARDEVLLRLRGGVEQELECATDGGTGLIRCMTRHPSGTVFIAAERGLFVIHPDVDVVDAVLLRDGSPAEPPVGVHCDRWDRLWVVTERQFGCVHTSQFFGRSFGVEDGVPAPPYRSLSVAEDGVLVLGTDSGAFSYRPDEAARPQLDRVIFDGRVVMPDASVAVGDAFAVALEGTAVGGGTPRWRREQHQSRLRLETRIEGYKPGDHRLEFTLYDRDLNFSPPQWISVRVPFPPRYDKRVLLASGGGGAVLLVLIALWLALRRPGPRLHAVAKGLMGAFLVAAVGLQILAGILEHGRSYPFIGFSMYSEVYRKDHLIYTPEFYGQLTDGHVERMWADHNCYTTLATWRAISKLHYGDQELRLHFLANRRRGWFGKKPLKGFELRVARTRLTSRGPRRVAPLILDRWQVER